MLGDPLTLSAATIAFVNSYPAASEAAVQSKAFNIVENSARRVVRSLSKTDLASMSLTKGTITTSHLPSDQGKRLRSMLRCDVGKADAALVSHDVAVYLVIDQEVATTAETTAALSRALGMLLLLLTSSTGSAALQTTSHLSDLLNGES